MSGIVARHEVSIAMSTEAKTSFTPGPWVADGCVVEHFDAPMMHDIAITRSNMLWTHGDDLAECEANARLIAAAPDLLMALEVTRQIMESDDKVHIGSSWWAMVNDAIAKARGVS